jgi:hypothetical protein
MAARKRAGINKQEGLLEAIWQLKDRAIRLLITTVGAVRDTCRGKGMLGSRAAVMNSEMRQQIASVEEDGSQWSRMVTIARTRDAVSQRRLINAVRQGRYF